MKTLSICLTVIAAIALIITGISDYGRWISYKRSCFDNLAYAANSSNIAEARNNLALAHNYIEQVNLTTGNTAYFNQTPKNDLGRWYGQRKMALDSLNNLVQQDSLIPGSVDRLTKDNALMKLREVLGGDDYITEPQHIHLYPDQNTYLFSYIIFAIMFCVFGCIWIGKAINSV